MMQSMKAKPIVKSKDVRSDGTIIEITIWELLTPTPPSTHSYKYRLYFGTRETCRVRYDNERGKGDHKHINSTEIEYAFNTLNQLLDDFENDIANWSEP